MRSYKTGVDARHFCERCGSPLFIRIEADPTTAILAITSLDKEPTAGATMHINVEAKAPWHEILDDLPQHDALPPLVGS